RVDAFVAARKVSEAGEGAAVRMLLATPSAPLLAAADFATALQAGAAALLGLLSCLFVAAFYRRLTRPLLDLRQATERIAAGDFSVELPVSGWGETARTAIAFNVMVARLRETSSRLAQAEKMVSVGTLVVGIAHEINNPLAFV